MIPIPLVEKLITLLECCDVSGCCYDIRWDYGNALYDLKIKLHNLELREAYTIIVQAANDDDRHSARIDYLRLKEQSGCFDVGAGILF
jgi:hypothetical protein